MRSAVLLLLFILPMQLTGQVVASDSIRWRLLDLHLDWGNEQIDSMDHSTARSDLASLELFLSLMINQSEAEYDSFMQETKHLKKNYRRKYGDDSFATSLFLFRLHMYRAIGSAQFENYALAARDIIKSHAAYKKMRDHHPAHPLTSMASGFFAVLTDQVPDRFARLVKLSGFDQTGQDGFELLKKSYLKLIGSGNSSELEAGLLWVLCLWEFEQDSDAIWKAWQLLDDNEQISELLLTRYVGLLSGFKAGEIDAVKSILDDMRRDGQMDRISYSYYQRGKVRLFERQEECLSDFKRFIDKAGQENFVKSAWLRMGYYWILKGNVSNANYCSKKVLSQGLALNWTDQQAVKETERKSGMNPKLLSLRLLYDGARYEDCLNETLAVLNSITTESDSFIAEVYYRKALSLEALDRINEALKVYEKILLEYGEVESYYIPKSALLAAQILSDKGAIEEALKYLDIGEQKNRYGFKKTFSRQIQSLRRKLKK